MDKERYSRHIKLSEIGIEGQQKLLEAKVLVIGAGGFGVSCVTVFSSSWSWNSGNNR